MSDDAASSGKSLGRSSAVMAAGTAVSRLLGFVRNWLLVGAVGATGMAANTFDLANKLPNMAFAIIACSSSFVRPKMSCSGKKNVTPNARPRAMIVTL